jgi:hypothetical protein
MRQRRQLTLAVLALMLGAAAGARAQSGGTISGIVSDEGGAPIAGADVAASGAKVHAITDSAGRFTLHPLDGGFYTVQARRLGYLAQRVTTDLDKNGHVDLAFHLVVRPALLDSVVVTADGKCPELKYSGFVCRRARGNGVFFTDDDLFDKGAREIGDIFRGVDGFRVEMRPSTFGRIPVPLSTHGGLCLNALVNGRPSALTNPIPRYADQMIAVEIYATAASVPDEYQRYAWGTTGRESQQFESHRGMIPNAAERCALVVYWTRFS